VRSDEALLAFHTPPRQFTPMSPLTITSSVLTATLLPQGAALVGLRHHKIPHDLVLGFADPAAHASVPIYAGALVGPVANRIANGEITLDGVRYQLPRNEAGETTLHSGPDGLHAETWHTLTHETDSITFTTTLQPNACGLPGTRHIRATYALLDCTLTLKITATTDAPTPLNIAAHPYWNLDGTVDLSGHQLHLATDHYLPTNSKNLPTGEIKSARGSALDFTETAKIPRIPDLDVNYCLADAPRTAPCYAATLIGQSGATLRIATTAPGLQVYNGAFLPNLTGVLRGHRDLGPYGAVALEPQHWPDAPNQPGFPAITLRPGATYTQITTYEINDKSALPTALRPE